MRVLLLLCVGVVACSASVEESVEDFSLGFDFSDGFLEETSLSENKEPCCLPEVWEGFFGETITYRKGGRPHEDDDDNLVMKMDRRGRGHEMSGEVKIGGLLAVDGTNKRVAAYMGVFARGHPKNVSVIVDFAKHEMYFADLSKKSCHKKKVDKAMRKQCVPKNATYFGSKRMGYGDKNAMEMDVWNVFVRKQKPVPLVADMQILVTPDLCIPVMEYGGAMKRGFRFGFGASYFNIEPKIKDTKVFTPPSYCDKAEELSETTAMMDPVVSGIMERFADE